MSGGELARKLIMRGQTGENHCGFSSGRVAPLEVHRGENKFA
jgi:hypothetical protein